jgi:uncharacterized protein YndB with AHSA1/START domain
MTGITTQLFRFASDAAPARVWAVLTTGRYLYGLAPASEWRPGVPVKFSSEAATLFGDVLAVEEPRRLSYTVRAGEGQPETYVTWEIVDDEGGSVVRLYVDEPDGDAGGESAWLRVVARLESLLADAGAADRRR